jgi:hypothetical protein
MDSPPINRYKNHRFPAEIISHAVWLYSRRSESDAVTSGKVSINLMRTQAVAIPAVLGIVTDLGRSALLEKPL